METAKWLRTVDVRELVTAPALVVTQWGAWVLQAWIGRESVCRRSCRGLQCELVAVVLKSCQLCLVYRVWQVMSAVESGDSQLELCFEVNSKDVGCGHVMVDLRMRRQRLTSEGKVEFVRIDTSDQLALCYDQLTHAVAARISLYLDMTLVGLVLL